MKDNITIHFQNGETKDVFMHRPFKDEFIWIEKFTYKVTDIIHIGDNILAYVELIKKTEQ